MQVEDVKVKPTAKLLKIIEETGLNQFARECGVDPMVLHRWIKGSGGVTARTIAKVRRATDLTYEEMVIEHKFLTSVRRFPRTA